MRPETLTRFLRASGCRGRRDRTECRRPARSPDAILRAGAGLDGDRSPDGPARVVYQSPRAYGRNASSITREERQLHPRSARVGEPTSARGLAPIGGAVAGLGVGTPLVSSWSHLLPSIGPGDPPAHARQRRPLGLNLGTALLALWLPADLPGASIAGALLVGASVGTSLALTAAALLGVRQAASSARG